MSLREEGLAEINPKECEEKMLRLEAKQVRVQGSVSSVEPVKTPFAHCTVESLQLFKAESVQTPFAYSKAESLQLFKAPSWNKLLDLESLQVFNMLNYNTTSIPRSYNLQNKNSIEL
ncbi:hypothetical protein M9H77_02341 [Catharanthus roseus]|uniref:Uncharacterized protein n=1 Tax=Catharanthus roseus TaxID=4058 RepID=A0ACC0C897_CATRO|nr:hypothetical protein M9H77_02341 [Catharanthus roseus]